VCVSAVVRFRSRALSPTQNLPAGRQAWNEDINFGQHVTAP
jgi:hypothetical protein